MTQKQMMTLLALLIVVPALLYGAWFLISPALFDQAVDEAFPVVSQPATEPTSEAVEPTEEALPTEAPLPTEVPQPTEEPVPTEDSSSEVAAEAESDEVMEEEPTLEPTEEPLPTETLPPPPTETPLPAPTETPLPAPTEAPAEPQALATGSFYQLDYEAEGQTTLYQLPDGSRLLRFEELVLENGPDLRVYLVPIDPIAADVSLGELGNYLDLGKLKGNIGNQNYEIPTDVDLSQFKSVLIWCAAFSVAFAASPLAPTTSSIIDEGTTAVAVAPPVPTIDLPDLGEAPEISHDVWINSDNPLQLADLRGQVVLVDFWTYDCYNCQNVLPSLNKWHNSYGGDDFKIISIHYPEFTYERDYNNVLDAVNRLEVEYPVALDNDGTTWRAYKQRYWPTWYVLDKEGHIRYKHIGEGGYQETEEVIEALLVQPHSGS
jgi:thiol-disulfide isomerase/thioredoxin